MSSVNDAIRVLHAYVRNSGNPHISYENLTPFLERFATHNREQQPDLADLTGPEGSRKFALYLEQLEEQNWITTERDTENRITSVYYRSFFSTEIKRWYAKMSDDRELPYPADEHLKISVPGGLVKPVNVTQSLMDWLKNDNLDPQQILLLHFPDNVRSMYITVEILQKDTPELVMYRIREYLRSEKNSSYMESKLRAVFRTRELLVHEMLQTALTKPDEAIHTVNNPNEFQFHFWTQLSSIIVKDYSKKNEKLDVEQSYCQAAYLLGYLSVHFKGVYQRVREREESVKLLSDKLVQPPFLFSMQQIYDFKDDKGIPITKRLSRDTINDLIGEMMTPEDGEEVSKLVSINAGDKKAFIIHRSQYVPVLLRRMSKLSRTIQQATVSRMTDLLYDDITERWMVSDDDFDLYLRDRVFELDPTVFSMLDFKVLFLVADGQTLPPGQKDVVYRFFDRQRSSMMPWRIILSMDRERMLKDAKLRLPLWMLIPIIRGIVRLFRKKSSRRSESSTGGPSAPAESQSQSNSPASRAQQLEAYRESVRKLQSRYLSEGQSADDRLKEIHESWNPLIDRSSKANLLEDVNSLCRDTLRRMKLSSRTSPPDQDRITELAKRIAANTAFDRIKNRRAFQEYLELYMLTVLMK